MVSEAKGVMIDSPNSEPTCSFRVEQSLCESHMDTLINHYLPSENSVIHLHMFFVIEFVDIFCIYYGSGTGKLRVGRCHLQ